MRAVEKNLRARASEHSSSFCHRFEQRPNFAHGSTFKLNGTIRYPLCIYTTWVRSEHPVQIAFHNATARVKLALSVYFDAVLFILGKLTQNSVERKVNEFVKAHEKKLKHSVYPTNCKGRPQRTNFLLPEAKDGEYLACLIC